MVLTLLTQVRKISYMTRKTTSGGCISNLSFSGNLHHADVVSFTATSWITNTSLWEMRACVLAFSKTNISIGDSHAGRMAKIHIEKLVRPIVSM